MIRRLRHDEDGFTVMELMVAMVIGSIVLTSLMFIFITGLSRSAQVTDRVTAAQDGRSAMDQITTLLSAQTCQNGDAPIISGNATTVKFYANTGNVSADPNEYQFRYDATTRKLWEDIWVPTDDASGNPVYQAAATRTRQVAESLTLPADGQLFKYYSFPTTGAIDTTSTGTPLTVPLSVSDTGAVVRTVVSFTIVPLRTRTADGRQTVLTGQSIAGSSDPNDPTNGPDC